MKKKIVILVVLAVFLISSATYAASSVKGTTTQLALEKVEYAEATVTVSRLNVREGPSTSFQSIYKLEKGQAVTVIGKLGDWYAIYDSGNGIVGAVDGRYVKMGEKLEANAVSKTNDVSVTASKEKTDTKTNEKTTPENGSNKTSTNGDLSQDEQTLLELVNKARTDEGLEQLVIDEKLMKVARTKAKDMTENNYFSHQSPTYGSPFDMMRQFESTFKSAGENIAGNKTVEGAFKAWMGSESHKKNILNSGFKVTGIGIESSSTYGKILVQQFIGR